MEALLSSASEYGFALFGSVATIGILGTVVRILWNQAKEDQANHLKILVDQFNARLLDKNTELSQVWEANRRKDEEIRIIRAEKEWLERMNDRGDDMLAEALGQLRARSGRGR